MSVYAMAKREVDAIDPSKEPQPQAPATTGAVGTAVLTPSLPGPLVAPVPVGTTGIGLALSSIGTYIPTEVMATYLAILAAIPIGRGHGFHWLMFWVFLIATPVVVWLGVAVARQSEGIVVRPAQQWPWWSMIAATVAFAAFVVVLPGSVAHDISWYESWMGTIAIILSAFVLGVGDQLFGSRRSATRPA
jgi:hypothetical protein